MRKYKGWLLAALIAAGIAGAAHAAGLFTNGLPIAGGSQYPNTLPLTGNETIPADTNLTQGLNPASEAITTGQLASQLAEWNLPRNVLDNGAMVVNQRGTGVATCGTATPPTATAAAADRWFCDGNGTTTGRMQIKTTGPTPPVGFTQSVIMYRNSATSTQPICTFQAITTARATSLQGKYVVLSAYLQALAGLSASGNAVSAYIITGTGTDEGFGTLTASPAITPAWAGLAGGTTANATWNTTTSWVRYNTAAVLIPTIATEVGVEICFTPGSSGAGVTDGIALTGVQLEVVPSNSNSYPSPFAFQPGGVELASAEQFFFQLNEPANGAAVNAICQATGANTNACTIPLPVQMRGTTPTITIQTAGTFAVNIAGTPTTIATPTAGTCSVLACNITAANTNTNGQAELVTGGAGGTGKWYVMNDKIM